jgi:hypothetical protein
MQAPLNGDALFAGTLSPVAVRGWPDQVDVSAASGGVPIPFGGTRP